MRGTIIIPITKPGLMALNSPRPGMKDLNTGVTKVNAKKPKHNCWYSC